MCVCVCMWSSLKQWELCGRTQNKIANNYKTSIFASHYVTDTLHDLFSSRSAKRYTTGQILKAKTQTSLSIPFFLNYGLFFFFNSLSLSLLCTYYARFWWAYDQRHTVHCSIWTEMPSIQSLLPSRTPNRHSHVKDPPPSPFPQKKFFPNSVLTFTWTYQNKCKINSFCVFPAFSRPRRRQVITLT